MHLIKAMLIAGLAWALPAPARAAANPAADTPAPYAVIDWPDPSNPRFVTLGGDHYLLSVRAGKQVWDARNNVFSMARGFPAHTGVERQWTALAGGTLITGRAHTEADLVHDSLIWWDPRARAFSAPLAFPPSTVVQALVPVNAQYALACLGSGKGGKRLDYDDLAASAVLIGLADGKPRIVAPTAATRAMLAAAGVRGTLDGRQIADGAAPAMPVLFDTSTCRWDVRARPPSLANVDDLTISHRRLADGRVVVTHADFVDPVARRRGTLGAPLLWDEKASRWIELPARGQGGGRPDDVSNYGIGDPVVALASTDSTHVAFLDPDSLHWIPSAQRLPDTYGPELAPLSTGEALLFTRGDGAVRRIYRVGAPQPAWPAARQSDPAGLAPSAGCAGAAGPPLPEKARFAAIAAEARRRARQEDPVAQSWSTLDRATLARMTRMPDFVALDSTAKEALIDQAGAWDLLPFDKPSDAQALWAFWYPERGIDKPVGPLGAGSGIIRRPDVFYADAGWGREAGAQVALMRCLPPPIWHVQHTEPMLWAMENGVFWGLPHEFGQCVRMQSNDNRPAPDVPLTARGAGSAAILEQKLSDYLLAQRCAGKGADSCLPLLHALISLNPDAVRLPAILNAIEPGFALATPLQIPSHLADRNGDLSAAENADLMALKRVAVHRLIFITAKLSVLLRHTAPWPPGELEQSWRKAFELGMLLHTANAMQASLHDGLNVETSAFANPWALLPKEATLSPATQEIVVRLGREYAAVPGCAPDLSGIAWLPDAFWIAFAIDKIGTEQTTCGVFSNNDGMGRRYAAALNGYPGALAPLAPLRTYLGQPGPAREEELGMLASGCPTDGKLKAGQTDPWKVCRHVWTARSSAPPAKRRPRKRR
ncbi:hypothetical protein [Massilia pseudoviolaceinigra]|uniref:hypothetical protein n=1 Tax=Massilia pseudoviolaceinigra TaxID=3057165 RepID=UPI002796D729|nr:hypothetical protein [Massilia sp. CCM 9206]MDQ1923314.1 hypothetical protein [Massilia sp. CCM 9206]